MPDYPCFSSCESTQALRGALAAIALVIALSSSTFACATVRPEERELLAEPSMSSDSASIAQTHDRHVLENREGSSGGGVARGGGCGCN